MTDKYGKRVKIGDWIFWCDYFTLNLQTWEWNGMAEVLGFHISAKEKLLYFHIPVRVGAEIKQIQYGLCSKQVEKISRNEKKRNEYFMLKKLEQ